MIYIASPYSSPIPEALALRFERVRRFTIHCLQMGIPAFSPIVYAHEMAKAGGIATDANTWVPFNTAMLRRSEAMFVYMLPGWKESKGVTLELRQAKSMMIPVAFWNEDFSPNTEQVV